MTEPKDFNLPEGAAGVVTDRSWSKEADLLNISKGEFWEGKRILALGPGKKSDDPQDVFPGADITSHDPAFYTGSEETYNLYPEFIKTNLVIRRNENNADNLVKGLGQSLPYADNSFDLVMSSFAVPMNVPINEKLTSLEESLRVCKPGGEVRIYPINLENNEDLAKFLNERAGFSLQIELTGPQKLVILKKNEE